MPSVLASNMVKNGIYQAASFPPAVQFNKLMVECARHYYPQTRTIVAPNGVVLAFLSEEAIRETFCIPHYDRMLNRTRQESTTLFEKVPRRLMGFVTSDWMSGPKRRQSKLPKKLMYTDFKDEYSDMVFMLNRITGSPQGVVFETWMFYYVEEISLGLKMINWAKLISDNLDVQLRNLERTRTFYMSSYVIYMLAKNIRYKGLICKGEVGNKRDQLKVYDWYPHLQLHEKEHHRRVNDGFLMYLTRLLQGGTHKRLSKEAMALVEKYGSWFI